MGGIGQNGRKRGRPPKVTRLWCTEKAKVLPQMFANGESRAEVCAKLGIWEEAFSKACEISPDFSKAYKKGRMLSEAWWAGLGRAGAEGKVNIQPATWIFNMKNRFKWSDKVDVTVDRPIQLIFDKEDENA